MSFVFSQAPDPKGNWKLSGLSVDYLHIARETTSFYLTVDYPELAGTSFASSSDCGEDDSQSICIHLQDIPAGVMFNRLTNGPFTNTGLGGIGVNLNVNIYDNGFGTVAQGSFYPDIELSESQACVTDLQIFAVDENFTWEMGPQSTFSNSNVIGMENGLLCQGDDPDTPAVECVDNTDEAWGFGLVTGLFDATPATPVPTKMPPVLPYIALTDGTVLGYSCGAWCAGPNGNDGGAASPQLPFSGDVSACIAACETWDYDTAFAYSGGVAPGYLTGGTGTSSKFNVNAGNSAMCEGGWTQGCNPDVDFKLVWNALDSYETGLGFGDDPDVDEDGDGTDFDRIFGVPYISATTLNTDNPLCDITGGTANGDAFNYALAGDIVSTLGDAGCDEDYDMMDSSTYCCSSGDHPFYLQSGLSASSLSAQYACGEATVAGFITNSCNDKTSAGIVEACSDTSTGAGTPALFATGFCGQQIQANLASCATAGWQAIVAGVCSGLGIDCSDDLGTAQAMFDQVCAGAAIANGIPAGQVTTCAGLAAATGEDQNVLECGFLASDFLIDADGDDINDTPFYLGACSTVAGGVTAAAPGGDNCSDWVETFSQDAIDTFATGNIGTSCTDYGNNFTNDCLETNGTPNSVNETEMYLLNPAAVPATYSHFVTYNGTVFQSIATQAASGPIPCGDAGLVAFDNSDLTGDGAVDADDIQAFAAGCNPHLLLDDSDHDFDPACLSDGNDSDCSGRLRLTFEPTCVPEIEARQIVSEFVNLLDVCENDGDIDYSCAAYDWNYNFLADADGDGIDAADCEAFATATGQSFVTNNGPVLPSCDYEDGITTNCTEYSATVVWNTLYNMCGDGDPNDLIDLGSNGFCALAVPSGMFEEASVANGCTSGSMIVDADGTTCAEQVCAGFYAQQGGVPSFEQNCTVGNGVLTVSDVIRIINHIIGNDTQGGESVNQLGGEAACAADLNADGNINVADVVQLVNNIINSQPGRVADATEASVVINNNKIVIDADGYVGGVDMIVEFTDNFSFELADGFASNYAINGNKAHIILVSDKDGISEVLTMTSGKVVSIEEALVVNSSDFITTSINQPSIFSVGAAYPNPFNPSTNISLVLNANADLSVKVYNLTGQLVDVIAEGNYSPSSYNWTWKAENLASGVYFIKTQVGSDINTQKVMLLK